MATSSFVSSGVYSIETDLSRLPKAAAQIGAAIIGLTKRGPAFFPVPVSSFGNFRAKFGGLDENMYVPYTVRSYLESAPLANIVRVLGRGNPSNGYLVDVGRAFVLAFGTTGVNNSATATFTASLSAVETLAVLRSRQDSSGNDLITYVNLTGTPNSFTADIGGTIVNDLSLDRTSKRFIRNILGINSKVVGGGDAASGVYVDRVLDYRYSAFTGSYTGSTWGSTNNPASGSATGIKYVQGYKTAETPIIVSQPYVSGTSTTVYSLFKLVSRTDGEQSNKDCKVVIRSIQTTTTSPKIAPQFYIDIRSYTDTDNAPQVLETWGPCDLDPQSPLYVARVIGDQYITVTITEVGGVPETVKTGKYPNKSNFVRCVMYESYKFDSRPMGFRGPTGINPWVGTLSNGLPAYENDMPLKTTHLSEDGYKSNFIIPGFLFEGNSAIGYEDRVAGTFSAVAGTLGSRGFMLIGTTAESTTFTPSLSSAYNASLTSQFTIMDCTLTGDANIVQDLLQFKVPLLGGFDGIPPSKSYTQAINDGTLSAEFQSALYTVQNPRFIDINLLLIPGVHTGAAAYNGQIVSRGIELCEDRSDCFYIADIGKTLTPSSTDITTDAQFTSVGEATQSVLGNNTNYAAVYYPWIQIYDPDVNQFVWCPPSVEVAGVYSYNDRIKAPWWAPAGFNRGTVEAVTDVRKYLTQTHSDALHTGRVNGIVSFVNQGLAVFDQMTLQKENTALNRVNVRRLLIYLKKVIAGIANLHLWEFNTVRGRQRLRNAIVPILERVQLQEGIGRFEVQIDEFNNPNDVIDRNQMRGTIIIEPTRAVEQIILNYVITTTGANFKEIQKQLNV